MLLGANAIEEQMKWFALEQQVTDRTPPAFLAHAINDKIVPPTLPRNSAIWEDPEERYCRLKLATISANWSSFAMLLKS
jgi:hypothetical protein